MDTKYAELIAELLLDEGATSGFLQEGVLGTVPLDTSKVDTSIFTFGFEVEFLFTGGGSTDSRSQADSISIYDLSTDDFESYWDYSSTAYRRAVQDLRTTWLENNLSDYHDKAVQEWKDAHEDEEDAEMDEDAIQERATELAEEDLPSDDSLIAEDGWTSFISNLDATPMYGYTDDGDEFYTEEPRGGSGGLYNVAEAMRRDLKIDPVVFDDAHDEEKEPDRWYVEPDGSLDADDSDDTEAEIGSPVFQDFEKGLSELKRILSWVDKVGYTNRSTGLHIGIGFKQPEGAPLAPKYSNIDLIKLIILLGEKHVAHPFARFNNTYAESHIQRWLMKGEAEIAKLLEIAKSWTAKGTEVPDAKLKAEMMRLVSKDKYRSVNIGKFTRSNYFEFRIMGGKDYHKKLKEVDAFCRRYAAAIQGALNPEEYRTEYLQQLARMMLKKKSDVAPSYIDSQFAKYLKGVESAFADWGYSSDANKLSQRALADLSVMNDIVRRVNEAPESYLPFPKQDFNKIVRMILKRKAKVEKMPLPLLLGGMDTRALMDIVGAEPQSEVKGRVEAPVAA